MTITLGISLQAPLPFIHTLAKTSLSQESWLVIVFQIQDPSKACVMDSVVFEGPPMTEQVLWPAHCVQNSWGAELHKDLKVQICILVFFRFMATILQNSKFQSCKEKDLKVQ